MPENLTLPLHPAFWLSLASMAVAQLVKPFVALVRGRRWSVGRMFYTGGMPSSHSSLVTTLTLCVAQVEGSSSPLFTISLLFSLYFVFEATGLRQEVGHQARVLNDMLDQYSKTHQVDRARLRELVGHTWGEVFGGILTGVLVWWLGRGLLAA